MYESCRIGSPMIPMLAMSPQKQAYIRQDQADWVRHWNAINSQERGPEKPIKLRFPDIFPIRSPVLLRIALVEPKTTPVLCTFPSDQNPHLRTSPPADAFLLTQSAPAGSKTSMSPTPKRSHRTSQPRASTVPTCSKGPRSSNSKTSSGPTPTKRSSLACAARPRTAY
jgi:hypothetical protein